ncbi:hypothetical protein SLS57_005095 [Botryosphaeria dothidea]
MQYSLLTLGLGGLLASGAAIPALTTRDVSAQQYEISTLKTHFMGKNSGIGDGSWSPGSIFNSTIELVINYPSPDPADTIGQWTTCTGSWVNGTHPEGWNGCDGDTTTGWRFTDFTTEAKFTIEVGRITGEYSAETGSVTVTANNLSDDNSWLTCLEGAPMTGIKCELNGMLSKKKAPIPVAITSGPAIGPF